MNYLTILLVGVINTETEDSVNYQIAQKLLEHVDELADLSATKIALLCNVSKASVTRFCKFMGLEDYLDFQIMCRYFAISEKHKFAFDSKTKNTSSVERYLSASINILDTLRNTIDETVLDRLTEDIHAYGKVAAFGHMQSGNVALTLQHDMTAAKKYIYSSHRYGRQKEYISRANHEALILIFSATGAYFEHTYQSDLTLRRKDRPKIYMITVSDEIEPKPYVDKVISLYGRYDFASSVLVLQEYASLIALKYYEKYGETDGR